jgi:type I restriction enzyme M protein
MVTCNPRRSRQAGATAKGYDLSLTRTKELVHQEVEHRPPLEIRLEPPALEQQILQGIAELE